MQEIILWASVIYIVWQDKEYFQKIPHKNALIQGVFCVVDT